MLRPDNPVFILIVLLVILLLFGAPKLPMIAKNVGKSLKIFKSEVEDLRGDGKKDDGDDDRAPQQITEAAPRGDVDADRDVRRDAAPRTEDGAEPRDPR